jgi:hypothetical protein
LHTCGNRVNKLLSRVAQQLLNVYLQHLEIKNIEGDL